MTRSASFALSGALEYYLKRIEAYRSTEQKRLLISYRRGMVKDISKQSISDNINRAFY